MEQRQMQRPILNNLTRRLCPMRTPLEPASRRLFARQSRNSKMRQRRNPQRAHHGQAFPFSNGVMEVLRVQERTSKKKMALHNKQMEPKSPDQVCNAVAKAIFCTVVTNPKRRNPLRVSQGDDKRQTHMQSGICNFTKSPRRLLESRP